MNYYFVEENSISGKVEEKYLSEEELIELLSCCEDYREITNPLPSGGTLTKIFHKETYEYNENIHWRLSDLSTGEEQQRLALIKASVKFHGFYSDYWVPYRLPEGKIGITWDQNEQLNYCIEFHGKDLVFEAFTPLFIEGALQWSLYEKAVNGIYEITSYE